MSGKINRSQQEKLKKRAKVLARKVALAAKDIRLMRESGTVSTPDFCLATLDLIRRVDPLFFATAVGAAEQALTVLLAQAGFRKISQPAKIELAVPYIWTTEDIPGQAPKLDPKEIKFNT